MKGDYLMTAEEITAAVAALHAKMDAAFSEQIADAEEMERLVAEGVKIGMVKPLAGKRAIRQAQTIRSKIVAAADFEAEMHAYHYKVAKDLGIDTPALGSVAGVVVMSGGR